jgi:hypothetical protein
MDGPTGPQGVTGVAGPTGALYFTPAFGEIITPAVPGSVNGSTYEKMLWVVDGEYSNVTIDTTSGYDITIVDSGVYLCSFDILLSEETTLHQWACAIYKNGVTQASSSAYISLTAFDQNVGGHGSVILRCSPGDVLDVRIVAFSGSGTVSNTHLSANYGSFRVVKLAP